MSPCFLFLKQTLIIYNHLFSMTMMTMIAALTDPNVSEEEELQLLKTKSLQRCNYADETTSFACRCIQQDDSVYIWVIWQRSHRRRLHCLHRYHHGIRKTLASLLLAVILLSIIKWTFSCLFTSHGRSVRMSACVPFSSSLPTPSSCLSS